MFFMLRFWLCTMILTCPAFLFWRGRCRNREDDEAPSHLESHNIIMYVSSSLNMLVVSPRWSSGLECKGRRGSFETSWPAGLDTSGLGWWFHLDTFFKASIWRGARKFISWLTSPGEAHVSWALQQGGREETMERAVWYSELRPMYPVGEDCGFHLYRATSLPALFGKSW